MLSITQLPHDELRQRGGADYNDHEEVWRAQDQDSGLISFIAIHNTGLGPALGGCRMWPYPSEEEALIDVLRLSRGMTYKNALARLPLGGGKAVIIGNSHTDKSDELLRAFGRFVNYLERRYITAEDVGTDVKDLEIVAKETKYIVGVSPKPTGDGGIRNGEPGEATARGVYIGICAAVKYKLGRPSLNGIRVSVQGLGHVGFELCRLLAKDGVALYVADTNSVAIKTVADELVVCIVEPDAIYDVEADVFAPCALGGIINDDTIKMLQVSIVAGSANNQLAKPRHGDELARCNILYAPDYVTNAGGVMDVFYDLKKTFDRDDLLKHLDGIGDTLKEIFERSEATGFPTNVIADRMAEEILLTG